MRSALVALALLLAGVAPALAAARDTAVVSGDAHDGQYLRCLPSAAPDATAAGLRATWFRDGAVVPGATVPTFPLLDGDVGHALSCAVGTAAGSAPVTVAAVPPAMVGGPNATFIANGDGSVACDAGEVRGLPEPVVSYLWLAGGVDTGVTGSRYTPPAGIPATSLTCLVTATNAGGSVSQVSAAPRLQFVVTAHASTRPVAHGAGTLESARPVSHPYIEITPWRVLDRLGRLRVLVQCYAAGRHTCHVALSLRRRGAGSLLGELRATLAANGKPQTVALPLAPAALASVAGRFAVRSEVSAAFATGEPARVTSRVTIDAARSRGLEWARALPGFATRLVRPASARLARSVVVIADRASGTYGSWQPICTGTMVRLGAGADPVVLTAAHCFSSLLPEASQAPVDLVGRGDLQYVVLDGSARVADRMDAPIAIVDGISVDPTAGVDLALVHARPLDTGTAIAGRPFAGIPALRYAPPIALPAPGSPVLVDSAPGSLSRRQTRLIGRYAGRVDVPGIGRVDEVVVAPTRRNDDPCFFGGSGSLGLDAQGDLFGPLTGRGEFGYPDGTNDFYNRSPDGLRLFAQPLAKALGLDRRVFDLDTICAYSTPRPGAVRAAAHAFGSYPVVEADG